MFSGGIERNQCHEIDYGVTDKLAFRISESFKYTGRLNML